MLNKDYHKTLELHNSEIIEKERNPEQLELWFINISINIFIEPII
jgi:hypothetical protein